MNSTVELWAQGIALNLIDISNKSLEQLSSSDPDFYDIAICIVEPQIADSAARDAYYQFTENDTENWVQWIKQTFGPQWGIVAQVVAEEGY
jgi:hypothetical protein